LDGIKEVGEDEGPLSLIEFDVQGSVLKVRGRSYDRQGARRVDWPNEFNESWIPSGRNEVYHAFDARYGDTDRNSAMGVTVFKFHPNRQAGEGYYIVHGSGAIQEGVVRFKLERIDAAELARLGLDPSPLTLDDDDRCATLVQKWTAL